MGLPLEQARECVAEADGSATCHRPLENQNPNLCGEAGISDFFLLVAGARFELATFGL